MGALLALGADPNRAAETPARSAPLFCAADRGHVEVVQLLLQGAPAPAAAAAAAAAAPPPPTALAAATGGGDAAAGGGVAVGAGANHAREARRGGGGGEGEGGEEREGESAAARADALPCEARALAEALNETVSDSAVPAERPAIGFGAREAALPAEPPRGEAAAAAPPRALARAARADAANAAGRTALHALSLIHI